MNSGSFVRIWMMILRYAYLLRGSRPRILELAYWPTVQMILWGFITKFLAGHSDLVAQTAGGLASHQRSHA
jgi:ABC-2 type transport system permease protein